MGVGPSLVSEEEINTCNTPPFTRILPKNYDPRSPSEGITRTPIEVACTPKRNFKAQVTSSLCNTPTISKSSIDNKIENAQSMSHNESDICDNFQAETVNEDVGSDLLDLEEISVSQQTCSEESLVSLVETKMETAEKKTNQLKKQLTYLETDMDGFSNNFLIEHPRIRQLRNCEGPIGLIANETNSSTVSSLDDTAETDIFLSKIESLSFTDISVDNPSFTVSDIDNESGSGDCDGPTKAINEWLITIEDDSHSLIPFDIPLDKEDKVAPAQKQCFTPDQKTKPTKERTPLGCLVQNRVHEPVKETSNLNKKQWRGIEEERARRGILVDENTPPMLPPVLDKVSSAPGKIMRARRNIDWDKDDATIII